MNIQSKDTGNTGVGALNPPPLFTLGGGQEKRGLKFSHILLAVFFATSTTMIILFFFLVQDYKNYKRIQVIVSSFDRSKVVEVGLDTIVGIRRLLLQDINKMPDPRNRGARYRSERNIARLVSATKDLAGVSKYDTALFANAGKLYYLSVQIQTKADLLPENITAKDVGVLRKDIEELLRINIDNVYYRLGTLRNSWLNDHMTTSSTIWAYKLILSSLTLLIILLFGIVIYRSILLRVIAEKKDKERGLFLEAAKAEIEDSKVLLSDFINNASSPMFARDLGGRFGILNAAFASLYGKEVWEIRGKTNSEFELLIGRKIHQSFSEMEELVIREQKAVSVRSETQHPVTGALFSFKETCFPIYKANGNLFGTGYIITDISETIARQKELEAAKEFAENASRVQERFLSSVSHEMRTPLNGIIGLVNLFESTSLTEEQKDYMESLRVSSNNLLILINDVLDMSKIQAGKMNIESIIFNLDNLLKNINNTFKHEATRKKLVFTIEVAPGTPSTLIGDPTRLGQVLINLIGNALKFTEQGSVKLIVHAQQLSDSIVNLHFRVQDTGIGISKEQLKRLFQSFSQAGADTHRKYGGTGLGLAISKTLVEIQAGKIYAESEVNEGTVFRFYIPYKVAKAGAAEVENTVPGSGVTSMLGIENNFPPLHCLIVEDNLINQKVAYHTLRKAGITADFANNGLEAVNILKAAQTRYDFILMDIEMPEMNGYDATIAIRNKLGLTRIPIIAMTASALSGDKAHCFEVGMNDYVPKPFTPEELFYTIRLHTGNEHIQDELISASLGAQEKITDRREKTNDAPPFDLNSLREMNDDIFVLEILDLFLESVPKSLQVLKDAITKGSDWEAVAKIAHKLKGSVGVLQMTGMRKCLTIIEASARTGQNLDQLPDTINDCLALFESVKDEISLKRDELRKKRD